MKFPVPLETVSLRHSNIPPSIYNPITKNIIQNTSGNRQSIRRQILNYQRNKLVLIACSKTKAFSGDEKIKAGDAYCSPLFQKSRRWAESRGLDYAIISAKYGLVWPNEQIKDYDLMLNELTKSQKKQWGARVAKEIHRWRLKNDFKKDKNGWVSADGTIITLAGKAYTDPLESSLATFSTMRNEEPIEVEQPLEGLQVGQRLSKLNSDWEAWYFSETGIPSPDGIFQLGTKGGI